MHRLTYLLPVHALLDDTYETTPLFVIHECSRISFIDAPKSLTVAFIDLFHMTWGKVDDAIYLAPGGGCEVLFSPGLSVCLSVCVSLCVCVCVCPADILVFYFSAIRRDIDLKFIQVTYKVVPNSLKKNDLHRSKVKVTGTVHCFLNVQSYHKNWAIEFFFFHRHLLRYSIR